MFVFYDTETTGLPLFKEPSEDPRQPHLVQLATIKTDEAGAQLDEMNVIIRPDGWEIPDDVAAIHGITTERAMDEGVPEAEALDAFIDLIELNFHNTTKTFTRVGHNELFDARIIRIALKRYRAELADAWKDLPASCTARMSQKIVGLPPSAAMAAHKMKMSKTPELGEAFEFFMGRPLEGAHDALVDVRGCRDVFFAIRSREQAGPAREAIINSPAINKAAIVAKTSGSMADAGF